MFLILFVLNAGVWIFALIASQKFPVLLGLVTLAYGLGLRHGVDADHIAAIDNTTRKLTNDGKRPVAVGFFFSLGHSTIVIILSIFIAFTSSYVKTNLSLVGTAISSFFLLFIGVINLIALFKMFRAKKDVAHHGFLNRLFDPFLKLVKNSVSMYFIGFLFGLGFDTASEVGILSIAAASGASGMPVVNILLLPLAFTAGMTLIDTLDGVLMLGAYGWARIKPARKFYYNVIITFISSMIALFIGGMEATEVLFHKKVDFGNLGYFIIAIFLVSWFISYLISTLKK